MKKFILISVIALFLTAVSIHAQYNYINNELDFEFICPSQSTISNGSAELNHYVIDIHIYSRNEMLGGKSSFNQVKKNIELGVFPDIPGPPNLFIKYLSINGFKVGIDLYRGSDIYDGVIGKQLLFIKNDKLILINLQYIFKGPAGMEDTTNIKVRFQNIILAYNRIAQAKGMTGFDVENYSINEIEKRILQNRDKETEIPREIVILFIKFEDLLKSLKIN